jgi:putative transposase
VVIVPKYRKRVLYGKMRRQIGQILRDLCRKSGVELLEGHLMPDDVHMVVSIPPKYSVANTVGFLKGKSAIRIHRELLKTRGTLFGREFRARGGGGYCVSTVGPNEPAVRQYIRDREKLDADVHQGTLDFE